MALGIYGPMTSYSQWHVAVVAAFRLDLQKNFDPLVAQRFGERPIIQVSNLHPQAGMTGNLTWAPAKK